MTCQPTVDRAPTAEGCRHCGAPQRGHAQRWMPPVGWHGWAEPTREQIHERMRARLAHRLAPSHD